MTEPTIAQARLAAPLADVHRALTDAEAMRAWLAEHAEVSLPDRYEFWGRYTPEGDAPHQRLRHVDDRSLRFSWLLDGEETEVEITLEPETPESTVLTVSQTGWSYEHVLTGSTRGVLQTFWALAIANLADHLDGRELTPKLDFTSSELRTEVLIDGPRDEVYDAMTDSAKISQWFGIPIEVEHEVGGTFSMGGQPVAKVIDLTPTGVSTDWGTIGISTWELADSGGKTRLTFVQSGFDESQPPYAAWLGWLSGIAELRRFVELDGWQPIWIPDESAVS
jgi:uncharacterized protein YndB with AHSA1/START domain